jgi:hypothetical protein
MNSLIEEVIDEEGIVHPKGIANHFHTTMKEVADLAGLSIDAVSKKARANSVNSQARLRDMVMIINRVTPWCGDTFQAYAWYRSEPIPSFDDLTAQALVRQGRADAVMRYLDRIADGGYA